MSNQFGSSADWTGRVPSTWPPVAPNTASAAANPSPYNHAKLESMVHMRLRSAPASFFDHWHMHRVGDEKVIVLIINKGVSTILEDEWPLFPSDALITKLRLLEN